MCRPGEIDAGPSQVSSLSQKDRQRFVLAGEIIRDLNITDVSTSMQAIRAFLLPKLDRGFVQPPMPCSGLISTVQHRQRRESQLGHLEEHKMEHITVPTS